MCSGQREKTDDYVLMTDLQKPRQVAQMWHADQDELIQFDLLAAQVRCHGVRIDLANTCRSCLDRITRCLADVGRHHEVWHLLPSERLKIAQQLRKDERQAARMFQVLHRSQRSEEHTSELQSLMRISYAVFCLNK